MTTSERVVQLSTLAPQQLAPYLALNNAHAVELSLMSEVDFAHAVAIATVARGYVPPNGLLLAYDEVASIGSVNYRWFKTRYDRFLYIDRVVIAPERRGSGLARRLYAELLIEAEQLGCGIVCCEVNLDPPNPASDAFHAAFGFKEVGRAVLADRNKIVRYLARVLAPG